MSQKRWQEALDTLTPLARHHAGPDVDEAYKCLQGFYPGIGLFGFPSGDVCGTWTAPKGWVVKKGQLIGPSGEIIADYFDHPLHLFTYSPSFTGRVTRDELENHLLSDPNRPNAVPFHFRNQYCSFEAEWGFCLPHNRRVALPEGEYQVQIETEFLGTEMRMGLQTHQGELEDSLLLVGHFDHPGQAGDGLIGCLAGHEALTRLGERQTKLTYRMLSTIEIVGSVFYADRCAPRDGVQEALFSAMSGVDAPLVYARSAHERATVDRIMEHLLKHWEGPSECVGFRGAVGNDEIAYDVYGVDIPCGSLMRWPHPDYHTDLDDAASMREDNMESFIRLLQRLIDVLEKNSVLTGKFQGLPQLGHPDIDLYISPGAISGVPEAQGEAAKKLLGKLPDGDARREAENASDRFNTMMTLLPPLADGRHTTLDIAERSGVPFALVDAYTDMWYEKGLLEKNWINPFSQEGENR